MSTSPHAYLDEGQTGHLGKTAIWGNPEKSLALQPGDYSADLLCD